MTIEEEVEFWRIRADEWLLHGLIREGNWGSIVARAPVHEVIWRALRRGMFADGWVQKTAEDIRELEVKPAGGGTE